MLQKCFTFKRNCEKNSIDNVPLFPLIILQVTGISYLWVYNITVDSTTLLFENKNLLTL